MFSAQGLNAKAQPRETPAKPRGEFRTDIQGMRAVAVVLVLLFHANVSFFSGGFVGVDMFFVISGFLITGLIIREVDRSGRIDIADFYARRIRRTLPAATLVLIVTVIGTLLILPPIRWKDTALEALGAAAYVANWIFAAGTGYQNAGLAVSPLQHFWTLSVEEQFYIVWPILLIAALAIAVKRSAKLTAQKGVSDGLGAPTVTLTQRFRDTATLGVILVIVPSFAWSVWYTQAAPAPAYFVTTTRLWELAIGAAVALTAHHLEKIPAKLALTLGWVGGLTLLGVSVTYTTTTPLFPGTSALLPTLATAALIISGMSGRAVSGIGALLSLKPMRFLGDVSYSLYLWHWPLIVFATFLLDGSLPVVWGIAVSAASIIPAWLSYRFVEEPFRDWKKLKASSAKAIRAGAGMIAVTAVTSVGAIWVTNSIGEIQPVAQNPKGALVLTSDVSDDNLESFEDLGAPIDVVEDGIAPAALEARDDNAQHYGDSECHREFEESDLNNCQFGDPEGETTVVLAGDSHAANWAPAVLDIAEAEGWNLQIHTKSGCGFALTEQVQDGREYPECTEWTQKLYDKLVEESPDLLITSNAGRRGVIENGEVLEGPAKERAFEQALESTWEGITDVGTEVVVIADTPDMGKDVADCVSANPSKLTRCAVPREEALDEIPKPELEAAQAVEGTEVVDMNNWVCPNKEYCPAVVGNTLVWRDSHHLTRTYAESLVEPLSAKLASLGVVSESQGDR